MSAWNEGKPIYHRLPAINEGYRIDETDEGYDPELNPPVARWLTEFWDELLVQTRGAIDAIPVTHLDPATAEAENLDWLAQLVGFTGDYWSTEWPVSVKRQLIGRSLSFVWIAKGTRELLEWLIEIFSLSARLYLTGEFLADINKAGDVLGGDPLRYYILVSLSDYLRTAPEWALLERLNRLYGPIYCSSRVCYKQFYADFSVVGDPVFS